MPSRAAAGAVPSATTTFHLKTAYAIGLATIFVTQLEMAVVAHLVNAGPSRVCSTHLARLPRRRVVRSFTSTRHYTGPHRV